MQADEAAHDGEAEAGSFIGPVIGGAGLEEGIAEMREIARRHADAGVADADDRAMCLPVALLTVTWPSRGVNLTALDKRLMRICLQARLSPIDLVELCRIGADSSTPLVCAFNLTMSQQRSISGATAKSLGTNVEGAGLDLRHVEDRIDDREQDAGRTAG